MDEREALDRETFAQVWSRVSPQGGGPVEILPADGDARRLREMVLAFLADASVYRDLARRTRRSVGALAEMARGKTAQAKRLSAAYFLMTGVRYWPRAVTPVNPPEGFFPALRQRYLAEARLVGALETLARGCGDEALRELYHALARETQELAWAIRRVVEQEV